MNADIEESKLEFAYDLVSWDQAYWSFTLFWNGEWWLTALAADTRGTVVHDERKSPLAADSNKAIILPNEIPNSNDHFRKIE